MSERRGATTLGWLLLLLLSGVCRAQEAGESMPQATLERSPVDDLIPPPPPVRLELRLTVGQFSHAGAGMKQIYGEDTLRFGAVGALFFGEGHGSLLYFGVARATDDGVAYGKYSRNRSDDTSTLVTWPLELGLSFRYPNLISERVYPTLRFGLDIQPLKETITSSEDESSIRVYQTTRAGAHMMVGLSMALKNDRPSWSVTARQGARGTVLFAEAGYHWVNDFGRSEVDLSGVALQGGVLLEF